MELYNQNTDIFKILSETQNSTFQTIQSVTNPGICLATLRGDFYSICLC